MLNYFEQILISTHAMQYLECEKKVTLFFILNLFFRSSWWKAESYERVMKNFRPYTLHQIWLNWFLGGWGKGFLIDPKTFQHLLISLSLSLSLPLSLSLHLHPILRPLSLYPFSLPVLHSPLSLLSVDSKARFFCPGKEDWIGFSVV